MLRLLAFVFLIFLSAGLREPVAAQAGADGLPARPTPFRFVNDQAQLMAPADARKLESGLRRYADNTGTQVVVVTVPSLGGRDVADYGRALGTAWGVGQRDKNNGIVVLVGAQERKVTIQAGSGLRDVITPAVTSRIIGEMTPGFKQGNYFAGLRTGLNTLMATANPSSAKGMPAATTAPDAAAQGAAGSAETAGNNSSNNLSDEVPAQAPSNDPIMAQPAPEPVSSGPGMGVLLIGALVIGGILWFVVRMFRNRSGGAATQAATQAASRPAPDFLPNRGNGPMGGNNQGGNYNQGGNSGGGMSNSGGGMGMGGMLATGAAAAAGAYLGNRMASGHDTSGSNLANDGTNAGFGAGAGTGAAAGAGAAGTAAAGDYFNSRDGGTGSGETAGPDYFSDANTAPDTSSDYFSTDDNNSSYDDTSSNDTGGGGFDGGDTDNNSGSW
ncbi:TPM domain-containing protein [Hymenobacter antarcticus]|uniref:TPM domain-containing protein n=1 Tax=Hymenobacter antarcticus TaxID=486270 RepID=A0ABP7PUZ2_9BACT